MIAPDRTNQRTFTLGDDFLRFQSPGKPAFKFEPNPQGEKLESPRSKLNRSSDIKDNSRRRIDFPKSYNSIEALNSEVFKKISIGEHSPHFAETDQQRHLASHSTHRHLLGSEKKPLQLQAESEAASQEEPQADSEDSQDEEVGSGDRRSRRKSSW